MVPSIGTCVTEVPGPGGSALRPCTADATPREASKIVFNFVSRAAVKHAWWPLQRAKENKCFQFGPDPGNP